MESGSGCSQHSQDHSGLGLAEVLHGHQPTPQVLFTFPTLSLAHMQGDPEVTPERFVT